MGQGQFYAVLFRGRHHLIRLDEIAAHGFLHEGVNAAAGAFPEHVAMLVQPARTDRGEVGLGLFEKLSVVGESPWCPQPLSGRRKAGLVRIGNADDLGFRQRQPAGVQTVSVVSPGGVADDGDAVFSEWHEAVVAAARTADKSGMDKGHERSHDRLNPER